MKIKFKKKVIIISHPYLPYTLMSNEKLLSVNKLIIPFKKKYFFPSLKVNSLGFLNGKNGNREFKRKNKTSYVIGCVGNSTTLNYIEYKKNLFLSFNIRVPIKKKI